VHRDPLATHEVADQPPPLTGDDMFGTDRALVASVELCATRLGDGGGRGFGTLPRHVDTGAIVAWQTPDGSRG
jgi:hypothetical protein